MFISLITLLTLLIGTAGVYWVFHAEGGRWISVIDKSPYGAVGREIALFLFMVGIPFVALITGAAGVNLLALGADLASPDHIAGFTFANWVRGFGIAAVTASGVVVLWWVIGKSGPHGLPWSIGIQAVRDAFYSEAHWVFYRAAPALLLNDPYWGVVVGTAAVALEWLAHPQAGAWLQSIEARQRLVLRLACLLSSGLLYLATRNLWLMILANLTIQIVGSRALGSNGAAESAERLPAP